jgi:hypothetical protein
MKSKGFGHMHRIATQEPSNMRSSCGTKIEASQNYRSQNLDVRFGQDYRIIQYVFCMLNDVGFLLNIDGIIEHRS